MKDTQTMKKAMKVTMKKMQTIFVRRRPRNTDDTSTDKGGCGSTSIEDCLEVREEQSTLSLDNSTESSPEPLEVPDDENADYFKYPCRGNQQYDQGLKTSNRVLDPVGNHNNEDRACGPIVEEQLALVPANYVATVVSSNTSQSVVLETCGDLENKCSIFPMELQKMIFSFKENLLRQYPPCYDFCVIASDDDCEEALKFKNFVSASFGLAGCTLYDGFFSLGSDLFDCYELMMDHSSKVFFFVTENFTSSAFCKRLQHGAVFASLMSKYKKDREKCVPVFPYGFPHGSNIPLSFLGIAGLNPSQPEMTKRSLVNTYTPQLRQLRCIRDQENFQRRCLEFEIHVIRCIKEYKANAFRNYISEISLCEKNNLSLEAPSSTMSAVPVVHVLEHDDSCKENDSERIHVIQSHNDTITHAVNTMKTENLVTENENREEHLVSPKKEPHIKTNQNGQARNVDCNSCIKNNNGDSEDDGVNSGDKNDLTSDIKKTLSQLDEILGEIVNRSVSTININDCATVQIGNTINVTINQAPTAAFSRHEQNVKCKTANFCEKGKADNFSENSDSD